VTAMKLGTLRRLVPVLLLLGAVTVSATGCLLVPIPVVVSVVPLDGLVVWSVELPIVVDDRGLVYTVDRFAGGLYVLEMTI